MEHQRDEVMKEFSPKINKDDLQQLTNKMMSLMSEALPDEIRGNKGPLLDEDKQEIAKGIAENILAIEMIGNSIQSELGKIDGLSEAERKELGGFMMTNEIRRVMLNAPDIIHAHLGRGFEEGARPFFAEHPTRGANREEPYNKNRPWEGTTYEAYKLALETLAQAGKNGRVGDGVIGLIKRFVRNIDGDLSKINYEGKPHRDTWDNPVRYEKDKYDEIAERTGVKYLPHQSPSIIKELLDETVRRAANYPLSELPTTKEGALKKLELFRSEEAKMERRIKEREDKQIKDRDDTRKFRFERKKREEQLRKEKEAEGPDYPGKHGESLD